MKDEKEHAKDSRIIYFNRFDDIIISIFCKSDLTAVFNLRDEGFDFKSFEIFIDEKIDDSFRVPYTVLIAKGLASLRASNANSNVAINFVERLRTRDKRARSDTRVTESIS